MTGQELLEQLQQMTKEQLESDVLFEALFTQWSQGVICEVEGVRISSFTDSILLEQKGKFDIICTQ